MLPLITNGDVQGLKTYYNEHIAPINEQLEKELGDYSQIDHIQLPLIRARVVELINTVSLMPNVDLYIGIDNIIDNVPIKEMDLFTILNIYLDNAIEEVASHEKAIAAVYMTITPDKFTLMVENSLKGKESTTKPLHTNKGLEIVRDIIITYPDIVVHTHIEMNWFKQKLVVISE